jgi:predicted transport protein
MMQYTKFEQISLKNHPILNEAWVQARIAEDPTILGLGDVILKDKERNQPRAGRLDMLLQDAELNRRYEVEIQLGTVDESHIIRTIEYWDIERKRYPQYDHTAVIIAEDVTSRFLNVISLFNGAIPLIAIQMKALKLGDQIGLDFTTVLDQVSLGLLDEDEETYEITNRAYWENRGSKKTVEMADQILALVQQFDPSLELKYNKFYIGMAQNGRAFNFVAVRPKRQFIRLEINLPHSVETTEKLESAGLDLMEYDTRNRNIRLRLKPGEITRYKDILLELMREAFDRKNGK